MSEVVRLFGRGTRDQIPEAVLPPVVTFAQEQRGPIAVGRVADLSGKPKVWCLIGSGASGKTFLARWLMWRLTERGGQAELAALDPANRSLPLWFSHVHTPESGVDPAIWLRDFLDFVADEKRNAIVDFGGGDTSLARVLAIEPDLHERLAEQGVAVIAAYLFGPRVDDLGLLRALSGFAPETTLLLANEGRKDSTLQADDAFASILSHSVFKKALSMGASALWLPALEADVALEVEEKHLTFGMARDGRVPEGATFYPIGGLRRSMVGRWLRRMEAAFSPVSSWLP